MPPVVQVDNLTKRYTGSFAFSSQTVLALDGVHLQVAPGEIFGLLGPNGAGKTTLVKILLGIVRPTQGAALLFGLPAHRPQARRRVGYLPEDHRFPDFLTATQMLDLYGRMAGVSQAERACRIPVLLEKVRMSAWSTMRIRKYSKGMLQRLGLAQALLNDADLLFLDEPTDGVDPIGRREIRDLLIELRDTGKTIFLNSHLLSEVEQVCTRVAILNRGRLVRQGTIAELTAAGRAYDVRCTRIPSAVLETLADRIFPINEDTILDASLASYRVQATHPRALNTLLDRLRSEDVLLESIRPVRQSLEDYFIDVVTEHR